MKLPCKKALLYYTSKYLPGHFFAYYRNRRWALVPRAGMWTKFNESHHANCEKYMFDRIKDGKVTVVPESEVPIPLPREMYKS